MTSKRRRAVSTLLQSETKWWPSAEGLIKVNVDGNIKQAVMGAVAQDFRGEVMAMMACIGQGKVPAEIAKACSLRRALQWAQDLTLCQIVIESACSSCDGNEQQSYHFQL
ncbi:hypothetical protein SLA2020_003790 [Shorea laevis]